MFNDIVLDKKGNVELCTATSREIKEYNSKFKDGLGILGTRRKRHVVSRIFSVNCDGILDLRASKISEDFENSGPSSLAKNKSVESRNTKKEN